jgi:hypothetical protein
LVNEYKVPQQPIVNVRVNIQGQGNIMPMTMSTVEQNKPSIGGKTRKDFKKNIKKTKKQKK